MKLKNTILTYSLALLALGCNPRTEQSREQSLMEISKQELAAALEERDQLLALVKEVSTGLQQIKELENLMTIESRNPEQNGQRRKRILNDIAELKNKVKERKKQLAELEERLQNSTINAKELTETIAALRLQIDTQIDEIETLRAKLESANAHIGALNSTVDSLNSTVTAVTGERDAAQTESVMLGNELNLCYYVVAPKSELKKHNILQSGFLRKTKVMQSDFDKSFFTTGDKRNLDTVPLGSRGAKILTNHPSGSYTMTEVYGRKCLVITDPEQFWSLSNYLVVQKD